MVWKSSKQLGIGFATHKKRNENCYVLVAIYNPPAKKNVDIQAFMSNVKKGSYRVSWLAKAKALNKLRKLKNKLG